MENLKKSFDDNGQLYKAMHIVNDIFSHKLKNYEQVTKLINIMLNKTFSVEIVKQFIEQLKIYPKLYGFLEIQSHAKFKEEIRIKCRQSAIPSVILTPTVVSCLNCKSDHKLEPKSTKFNKEPLLFGVTCIGNIQFETFLRIF
jgi:hypothetical protein